MPVGRVTREHWPHNHLPFVKVEKWPLDEESINFVHRETEEAEEKWTKNPNGGWDIERTFKVDY